MLQSKGLYIYNFEDKTSISINDGSDGRSVQHINWSPLSNFLCFYIKNSPNNIPLTQDNCFIWSLSQKTVFFSFICKNPNNWGIQWTPNELFFARFSQTPGELVVTNTISPSTPCFFFKDPNMSSFSLSPSVSSPKIAIYFSGDKGAPSSVRIYAFPGGLSTTPKSTRSFYKADSVELLWNFSGSHLIAFVHSDEDRQGKSYYGHSSIIFMSCEGKFDAQLTLGNYYERHRSLF